MESIEKVDKKKNLEEYLKNLGSVAVAFSGGVDSTFLLKVAHDLLKDRCIAVTALSAGFPERERREAEAFCQKEEIRQICFDAKEFESEEIRKNPPNRCYLCKRKIFSGICAIAKANGIAAVVEGSNRDDEGDYRPGMMAIEELGVKSPLRAADLYKSEIRAFSKEMGLPTWKKPSYACLYTRFVYGEEITPEKLQMVGSAEQFLMDLGFIQLRVRIHGTMARIEVPLKDFPRILEGDTREKIYRRLKELGFSYVTLDLGGYRTGSMNETLANRS